MHIPMPRACSGCGATATVVVLGMDRVDGGGGVHSREGLDLIR